MTAVEDNQLAVARARIADRDEARRAAVTASFASPEGEIAVLGSMMLDPDTAKLIVRIITPSDFFDRARAEVFASAIDVVELHGGCDSVTLAAELRARGLFDRLGGYDYLSRIVTETPSAANGEVYARLVLRLARQRRLREASEALRVADTAEAAARASEKVRAFLTGEPRRVVYVPGRIINFVL